MAEIEPFHLYSATGHHTRIHQQGKLKLSDEVAINNVCHAPRATHNLISLAMLLDAGAAVYKAERFQIVIMKKLSFTTVRLHFNRAEGSSVWKMKLPDSGRSTK
ncbi:MAG: hypothetical protein EOP50_02070, partial [Sphingobacteriales bacterium]